jgi:lipopolysaccharide export system protein LptC
MSAAADAWRERRRRAMLPGSRRDQVIAIAKIALPAVAGLLLVVLVALPLSVNQEFSFLLSKDSAMKAGERMRMLEAEYRGETAAGEPFVLRARTGVQKTSSVPIVVLTGLSASIERAEGPATVTAPGGEFLIQENRALVRGPVVAHGDGGYTVNGDLIAIDLNRSTVRSDRPVSGVLPMGSFRADSFSAEMTGRHVTLSGHTHLKIIPNRRPQQ